MRHRRQSLFRQLSGGSTEAAQIGPRVVSEESCHEDRSRESDERTPSRRFEYAASCAGGFVRAGRELDSCTGLRASNLCQRPGKTLCFQHSEYREQGESASMVQRPPGLVLKYRWL